jgi:hypothetical protein
MYSDALIFVVAVGIFFAGAVIGGRLSNQGRESGEAMWNVDAIPAWLTSDVGQIFCSDT